MSRGKNRQRWHCRACNKVSFGSRSRAMDTVELVAVESVREKKPIRAYPCPRGNGWHTTSEERKSA